MRRLSALIKLSGGIYFGDDVAEQLKLITATEAERGSFLHTVRLRCSPRIYAFLREGLQRYPLSQIRLSRPLKQDQWKPGKAASVMVLDAISTPGETHPYPVELDLPSWTVARDVDFRRWLFGFGADVIIEVPKQYLRTTSLTFSGLSSM